MPSSRDPALKEQELKHIAAISLIVALLALPLAARAGEETPGRDSAAGKKEAVPVLLNDRAVQLTDSLTVAFKTRRFVGSHTSYEFGAPFPPRQSPLSRLEFPLDSWWAGGEFRFNFPRFSAGAEALTNVSGEASGHMRDSDWDDEARPHFKTIYSESKCHIDPGCTLRTDIDLKISDWLCLPSWLDLRPLVGFRWQYFNFLAHDALQVYPGGNQPSIWLPGDVLRFEQTYWHYFGGARAAVDLGKPAGLDSLTALLQFDWGYVEGHNVDHHLLRGPRYTYEDTDGDA